MKSYERQPGGEPARVSEKTVHTQSPPEAGAVEVLPPSTSQTQIPGAFPASADISNAEEQAPALVVGKPLEQEESEPDLKSALPEADADEQPRASGLRWPTRGQIVAWLPFWAVMLLGAVLRFWDLGAKPLHHDESLHAYFALQQVLHNTLWQWSSCANGTNPGCYQYNPLMHGPFQFHAIALVYQVSQWLGAADNGVNTTTVRIMAALLGSVLVCLPYFLRDYLGRTGAWLACLFLAVSPGMVYFSRFAREDIYMACFTLLLVVAAGRYIRERKMRWLLLASAGFALSYTTSEATFLTIAVFGSFLGALIVWEIGSKISWRARFAGQRAARFLPHTFAPLTLLGYFLLAGIMAKVALAQLEQLSTYINAHTSVADADLANLEGFTVRLVPWLGIILGLYVFSILAREIYGKLPAAGRRGLARLVDRRQPVLDTLLTMPWTHWFFALILAFALFLVLFTALFTNVYNGIGDGIWRGLYYWLEQQNVARGGQPWYYYLLLIPLYEQVGVVFGIVGIVRCLWRPNAFRLFLVYWFLGNLFLYSWAGEKMPWLVIFITLPLLLLAALGVEPCVMTCYHFARVRFFSPTPPTPVSALPAPRIHANPGVARVACGLLGGVAVVLLLLPTIHNMYEVSYVHPADGPHEMLVYVQTTTDVDRVMSQINQVDQKHFGGKHQVFIGVTDDATWPFAWYLRDYPNLCFGFPEKCPSWKNTVPIIISGGDDPYGDINAYAPANGKYLYHEYQMRSWWDEGYKLPACQPGQKPSNTCADPNLGSGVGPLLWLSYGDTPAPGATFNPGLTLAHLWNWWWQRQPFGGTVSNHYDMELFIQKGLGVTP
ncbi:MAG TPA: flippase activity-associated protein Agl23 [Ktedonobacteraceae bacterium]